MIMIHALVAPLALVSALVAGQVAAPNQSLLEPTAAVLKGSERTRILVLATPHLSALRGFEAASVEGLLSTLTRFRPARICIEALPGASIEFMRAAAPEYDDVLQQFASGALASSDARP